MCLSGFESRSCRRSYRRRYRQSYRQSYRRQVQRESLTQPAGDDPLAMLNHRGIPKYVMDHSPSRQARLPSPPPRVVHPVFHRVSRGRRKVMWRNGVPTQSKGEGRRGGDRRGVESATVNDGTCVTSLVASVALVRQGFAKSAGAAAGYTRTARTLSSVGVDLTHSPSKESPAAVVRQPDPCFSPSRNIPVTLPAGEGGPDKIKSDVLASTLISIPHPRCPQHHPRYHSFDQASPPEQPAAK